MKQTKRVTVIGGGFSGLVQAFYLSEAGIPVRLLEKSPRLGGLLGSSRHQGNLVEQAANAFLANQELERVGAVIGVKWVSKTPAARRRFIYRNGQMARWPLSLSESLPLLPFLIGKKWKNRNTAATDTETLRDWGLRHLGEVVTDNLLEPAMQGVYATDLKNLDAQLILQSLNNKLPKGRLRGSIAPSGGMQEWVDKMVLYLLARGVDISLSHPVQNFAATEPTIFALGLSALKKLANQQQIPIHKSILETECASLTSVTLAFDDIHQRLQEGFGCLFPKAEGFHSLGVLFNHSIFPGRTTTGASETWILNDQKSEFSSMSGSALLRYVMSDRSLLSRDVAEPDVCKVSQWPQRIPVYNRALKNFLQEHKMEKPPFLLVGNFLGDLGLSKILSHAKQNRELIQGGYFG